MLREITTEFLWEVPQEGFRWVEGAPEDAEEGFFYEGDKASLSSDFMVASPWLIGPPLEAKTPKRTLYPLEGFPGLHRQFAGLPLEKEAILSFANRFGRLTKGMVLVKERRGETFFHYRAEPLSFWRRGIQRMRDALLLVDLIKAEGVRLPTAPKLEDVIKWEEDGVYFRPAGKEVWEKYSKLLDYYQMAARRARTSANREVLRRIEERASQIRQEFVEELKGKARITLGEHLIASPTFHGEKFAEWVKKKDIRGPALFLLARMVSEKLAGRVSFKLEAYQKGFMLKIVPRDLLSALWLELFYEIVGKVKIKQCPICGAWFDASRAPQRIYCSSACRQKAARYRKKLRASTAAGTDIEEAAKQLGLSPYVARLLLGL